MFPGIFIAGTDTDIGKTLIAGGLLKWVRSQGVDAAYFKAVQSGGIWENGKPVSGDTSRVIDYCELQEDMHLMNPYALEPEFSPHLAAQLSGITIKRGRILSAFEQLKRRHEFIVAEGAGGLVVPLIAQKYHICDLIKDLQLPVVLVARAGLGMINHTILSCSFLQKLQLPVKGIIINNYTGRPDEDDNINYIKALSGQPILGIIKHLKLRGDQSDRPLIAAEFERQPGLHQLLQQD